MNALTIVLGVLAFGGAEPQDRPRRHTLWLDFAGGPIGVQDEAGAGDLTCVDVEFRYPPFLGSGTVAFAVLGEARRLLAPYGVIVTADPPPSELPVTRIRIGASPELLRLDPMLNGLSCPGIDCANGSKSDNGFVFSDKTAPTLPLIAEADRGVGIGRIAVHEAAHAWGLEHAGVGDSIMARFPSAADQSFLSGCVAMDVDGAAACAAEHARHCPPGEQDAHAEMLARFGAGDPDTLPPTLVIVSPIDGEWFEPGTEITVEVEIDDDRGEVGWSLHVPELTWSWAAPPGETTRDLVLPAGSLTLAFEAIDADGNVTRRAIAIEVSAPPDSPVTASAACACAAPGQPRRDAAWIIALWVTGPLFRARSRRRIH